jgi:hypothetical protein
MLNEHHPSHLNWGAILSFPQLHSVEAHAGQKTADQQGKTD